jgi:hypothetical protein
MDNCNDFMARPQNVRHNVRCSWMRETYEGMAGFLRRARPEISTRNCRPVAEIKINRSEIIAKELRA